METVELESMAIEMPAVEGHPNREPFRGVLTLVDVASDQAPAGARGHRVVLTRAAAEAASAVVAGYGAGLCAGARPARRAAEGWSDYTSGNCGPQPGAGWISVCQGLSGDREGDLGEPNAGIRGESREHSLLRSWGCRMKSLMRELRT